jgi:hypothetical protein
MKAQIRHERIEDLNGRNLITVAPCEQGCEATSGREPARLEGKTGTRIGTIGSKPHILARPRLHWCGRVRVEQCCDLVAETTQQRVRGRGLVFCVDAKDAQAEFVEVVLLRLAVNKIRGLRNNVRQPSFNSVAQLHYRSGGACHTPELPQLIVARQARNDHRIQAARCQ